MQIDLHSATCIMFCTFRNKKVQASLKFTRPNFIKKISMQSALRLIKFIKLKVLWSPDYFIFTRILIHVSEIRHLPVFLPAFYATMIKPYLNLDWSYKIIIMLVEVRKRGTMRNSGNQVITIYSKNMDHKYL